jgi:hypothetical protein
MSERKLYLKSHDHSAGRIASSLYQLPVHPASRSVSVCIAPTTKGYVRDTLGKLGSYHPISVSRAVPRTRTTGLNANAN